jgi:hypothetical protein
MTALIIVVISVWLLLPSPQKYSESFENGMGAWIADADVPEDPTILDNRLNGALGVWKIFHVQVDFR